MGTTTHIEIALGFAKPGEDPAAVARGAHEFSHAYTRTSEEGCKWTWTVERDDLVKALASAPSLFDDGERLIIMYDWDRCAATGTPIAIVHSIRDPQVTPLGRLVGHETVSTPRAN